MIRKLTLALFLTLPTMAVAIDFEGFYISAKGGVSKTSDTGLTNFTNHLGGSFTLESNDLGTGTTFGFSVGKYLTNNFRLELEAIKRTNFDYNALIGPDFFELGDKADIDSTSLSINGFYNFHTLTIGNNSITPYLGGGIGISRNKMGSITEYIANGVGAGSTSWLVDGNTITELAYKLSGGASVNLSKNLALNLNYQYAHLGEFESGTGNYNPSGVKFSNLVGPSNGGEIKTQELMVGLQYTFK